MYRCSLCDICRDDIQVVDQRLLLLSVGQVELQLANRVRLEVLRLHRSASRLPSEGG